MPTSNHFSPTYRVGDTANVQHLIVFAMAPKKIRRIATPCRKRQEKKNSFDLPVSTVLARAYARMKSDLKLLPNPPKAPYRISFPCTGIWSAGQGLVQVLEEDGFDSVHMMDIDPQLAGC